eukprot:1158599-Pelagomonas_calceolata.AAC.2
MQASASSLILSGDTGTDVMNLKSLLSFEHRLVRTARSALLTSDSAFRTAEAFPGSFYVVASCRAAHFFCKGSELIHRKPLPEKEGVASPASPYPELIIQKGREPAKEQGELLAEGIQGQHLPDYAKQTGRTMTATKRSGRSCSNFYHRPGAATVGDRMAGQREKDKLTGGILLINIKQVSPLLHQADMLSRYIKQPIAKQPIVKQPIVKQPIVTLHIADMFSRHTKQTILHKQVSSILDMEQASHA